MASPLYINNYVYLPPPFVPITVGLLGNNNYYLETIYVNCSFYQTTGAGGLGFFLRSSATNIFIANPTAPAAGTFNNLIDVVLNPRIVLPRGNDINFLLAGSALATLVVFNIAIYGTILS